MADKKITFETALLELEDIVNKLDGGELSLDSSMAELEKACGLIALCEKRLSQARAKVSAIVENEDGVSIKPFDNTRDEA